MKLLHKDAEKTVSYITESETICVNISSVEVVISLEKKEGFVLVTTSNKGKTHSISTVPVTVLDGTLQ